MSLFWKLCECNISTKTFKPKVTLMKTKFLIGLFSFLGIWRSALFDWTDESSHAYSGGALPKINLLRDILLLEKAMAPHSSTPAWKIRWMEEPGRLRSMLRVGHDWVTSLSPFTFMHWRRKWQPTPVFLPGESQGWGSLVGCCLWGRTESDTTEAT